VRKLQSGPGRGGSAGRWDHPPRRPSAPSSFEGRGPAPFLCLRLPSRGLQASAGRPALAARRALVNEASRDGARRLRHTASRPHAKDCPFAAACALVRGPIFWWLKNHLCLHAPLERMASPPFSVALHAGDLAAHRPHHSPITTMPLQTPPGRYRACRCSRSARTAGRLSHSPAAWLASFRARWFWRPVAGWSLTHDAGSCNRHRFYLRAASVPAPTR
jgi:hypothetical protein